LALKYSSTWARNRCVAQVVAMSMSMESPDENLFTKIYCFEEICQLRPGTKGANTEKPSEIPNHWPPGVIIDPGKWIGWLPEGWGQGIKTTSGGKPLKCYITPEGKMFYHKTEIEKSLGEKLANPQELAAAAKSADPLCLKINIPSWPEGGWLPKDWRIAFRRLPKNLHKVYIPPNQSHGFLYHRSDVLDFMIGKKSVSPFGTSKFMSEIMQETAQRVQETGEIPYKKRRRDHGEPLASACCGVPQSGWAQCTSLEDAKKGISEFQGLLAQRGFGSSAGFVAVYGLPEGHRHALRVRGIYFRMPEPVDGRPCYQKLMSSPESTQRMGCDGVYIRWIPRLKQWSICAGLEDDQKVPRFAYNEEAQIRVSDCKGNWQVATDDKGADAFAVEPLLALHVGGAEASGEPEVAA